jgi:hypothetical protein
MDLVKDTLRGIVVTLEPLLIGHLDELRAAASDPLIWE